jgi:hypothetical protein
MEQLGIEQGPTIGRLLNVLGEAQVVGEISTADQALELAKTLLNAPESSDES